MAQKIDLTNEPAQKLTVSLNEHSFELTVRDIGGICLMDITADGAVLAKALPCFANQPVIPYAYLARLGNFVFIGASDDYPTYQTFEKGCALYYLTPQEVSDAAAA
ncbi:phage baseplate plug family protein [Candidatus Avelusimicrobium alvi]|uniref:phage baseplate plug family protein n=1 Tax=Candidatus Avelusimicrobium alvi TaxID=3416221 RepID=UPI003D0E8BE8